MSSNAQPSEATIAEKLQCMARRLGLADIYAFGSQARVALEQLNATRCDPLRFAPNLDLDIGVRPFYGVHLTARQRVDLALELEDLFSVPRVDLVLLPEADPYLALEIVRGELLYTADADEEARYQLFVLRRAADLARFQRERIRMILEEGGR